MDNLWYTKFEVRQLLQKFRGLIIKHKSVLLYLLFGVFTTVVNYAIYFPLYNFLFLSATLSNIIAWFFAVVFSFVTNKPLVFNSKDWSCKTILHELSKFFICRLASGLLESAILLVTVDIMQWNGNWVKIIVGFAIVIINFLMSKFLVFHK